VTAILAAPPRRETTRVPDLQGDTHERAQAELGRARLKPIFEGADSVDATVVRQGPPAGSVVEMGATVTAIFAAPPALQLRPPPPTQTVAQANKPGGATPQQWEPDPNAHRDNAPVSPQGVWVTQTQRQSLGHAAILFAVLGLLIVSFLGIGVRGRRRKAPRGRTVSPVHIALQWDPADSRVVRSDPPPPARPSVGVRLGADPTVSRVRQRITAE
jgi:hypothetical protein